MTDIDDTSTALEVIDPEWSRLEEINLETGERSPLWTRRADVTALRAAGGGQAGNTVIKTSLGVSVVAGAPDDVAAALQFVLRGSAPIFDPELREKAAQVKWAPPE